MADFYNPPAHALNSDSPSDYEVPAADAIRSSILSWGGVLYQTWVAGTARINNQVLAGYQVEVWKYAPGAADRLATTIVGDTGFWKAFVTPWTGPVLVMLIDKRGEPWEADQVLTEGMLLAPTTWTGKQYRVTVAGSSGSAEPAWWEDGLQSFGGGAVAEAQDYRFPYTLGPLYPFYQDIEVVA